MPARHEILGGKVQLYKRPGGRFWQCSTSIGGKQHRTTTEREELSQAEDAAEDWYLELRGMFKRGDLGKLIAAKAEKTFKDAAEQFLREFPVITEGQRNARYVAGHEARLRNYLIPFMGDKPVSEVTAGLTTEYRIDRITKTKERTGKLPARNTIHQEIVVLRQTLKTAMRHGWLGTLPDLSEPYKKNGKVSHRAWFSPDEYRKLYTATRRRAKKPLNARYKWEGEQLHDLVLFTANSGLRPDEVMRLQYRDVTVVDDVGSGETILEIEVRGKRGFGPCKSTANAVPVFQRLRRRNKPKEDDLLFPITHRELFNTILDEENLKVDREGQVRTLYSLRHTYICFRLMEGADIYQIAKNCRTSVEMIEKYYASHIMGQLDASAINVRRPRPPKKQVQEAREGELAELS